MSITPTTPVIENARKIEITAPANIIVFKIFDLKKGLCPCIYGMSIKLKIYILNAAKAEGSEKIEVALKKFSNFKLSCRTSYISTAPR